LLVLLGLAKTQLTLPAEPCAEGDYTSPDCSREIIGGDKRKLELKLTYWVSSVKNENEDWLPWLRGRYEFKKRLSSRTNKSHDMRLCFEIGNEGEALTSRA